MKTKEIITSNQPLSQNWQKLSLQTENCQLKSTSKPKLAKITTLNRKSKEITNFNPLLSQYCQKSLLHITSHEIDTSNPWQKLLLETGKFYLKATFKLK